jgi:NAD(P)H-dependent FMN reductase
MVEAAARGAAVEPTVRVRLLSAPVAQAADLLEADGYIFGTPENLAAMAGLMKDFFDRTYYPALDQISGTPLRDADLRRQRRTQRGPSG